MISAFYRVVNLTQQYIQILTGQCECTQGCIYYLESVLLFQCQQSSRTLLSLTQYHHVHVSSLSTWNLAHSQLLPQVFVSNQHRLQSSYMYLIFHQQTSLCMNPITYKNCFHIEIKKIKRLCIFLNYYSWLSSLFKNCIWTRVGKKVMHDLILFRLQIRIETWSFAHFKSRVCWLCVWN